MQTMLVLFYTNEKKTSRIFKRENFITQKLNKKL